MKRFIIILIAIILSVYIIPFAVIGLLAEQTNPAPTASRDAAHTVSVYDKDTDKITEYDLEEYLIGVVAAEMPASYEAEALKAQAVAARSYILSREGSGNPDHKGADVCNDPSHCKAYLSAKEADKKWGAQWSEKYLDKIKSAVYDTKGEYIAYGGEAAVACFSAVSSGKTESAADVWGTDTPYLQSVDSPGDLTYSNLTASVSVPLSEFCEKLGVSSASVGETSKTEGGSVKTINIGGKDFSGTQIRSLFGLKSANFELSINDGEAVFTTKGNGHGVGMSQYGANQMAKDGKNYTEILLHYYSNVTIEKL